jgi:hypothetical protein
MDRLGEGRLAIPLPASEHQNFAGRDHFRRGLLLIVLPDKMPARYPSASWFACGLICADARPQTKRSNFLWEQDDDVGLDQKRS